MKLLMGQNIARQNNLYQKILKNNSLVEEKLSDSEAEDYLSDNNAKVLARQNNNASPNTKERNKSINKALSKKGLNLSYELMMNQKEIRNLERKLL